MRLFLSLPLIMAFLLPLPLPALAALSNREQALIPLFEEPCRRFGIPRVLALAIARQESDCRPLLINIRGKDVLPRTHAEALRLAEACLAKGLSFDVGLMQINSYWIRRYRIPLSRLFHPRDNIYVACFILAEGMRRDGPTWKAVGHYHSHTPWRRDDYIARIRQHLRNILER